MSHDLSRDGYAKNRDMRYAKVRRQQGRLFTDAEFNEQVDIDDRRVRDFITDLIGPHAGPKIRDKVVSGFGLDATLDGADRKSFPVKALTASHGPYFVDGVRVFHPPPGINTDQSPSPPPSDRFDLAAVKKLVPKGGEGLLFYLDVWNVAVTPIEKPALRDRGFGDCESCNREEWVWAIRAALVNATDVDPRELAVAAFLNPETRKPAVETFAFLDSDTRQPTALAGPRSAGKEFGGLRFAVGAPTDADDGCLVTPDVFAYSGPSSQLYRVEVHTAGTVTADGARHAGFKWSRDNAAPAFAVTKPTQGGGVNPLSSVRAGTWQLNLENLVALGGRRVLEPHHWVEPIAPGLGPLPLLWVKTIDPDEKVVTLSLGPNPDNDKFSPGQKELPSEVGEQLNKVKKLVLWDHRGGTFAGLAASGVADPTKDHNLEAKFGLFLEHGVRAFLEEKKAYLAGEYWQYPARPGLVNPPDPKFRGPDGPEHLYAPLLFIKADGTKTKLRRFFMRLDTEQE